jgi:hypothetical protein
MLFKGLGSFKKNFKIGGNVDELKAYRLIPLTPHPFFHFTLPLTSPFPSLCSQFSTSSFPPYISKHQFFPFFSSIFLFLSLLYFSLFSSHYFLLSFFVSSFLSFFLSLFLLIPFTFSLERDLPILSSLFFYVFFFSSHPTSSCSHPPLPFLFFS